MLPTTSFPYQLQTIQSFSALKSFHLSANLLFIFASLPALLILPFCKGKGEL